MDNNTLLSILAGIVILALVAFGIWYRLVRDPLAKDTKLAENFLKELEDTIYNSIVSTIDSFDFSKYTSIPEMEYDVLESIYDKVWEFVEAKLKEASRNDILTIMAIKICNREFVDKFVDSLINKHNCFEPLVNKFQASKIEDATDSIAEEDKKIEAEYSDPNLYVEDSSTIELKPAEEETPTEEELKNINPPREEDEEYNKDDISQELLDEDPMDPINKYPNKNSLIDPLKNQEQKDNSVSIDAT